MIVDPLRYARRVVRQTMVCALQRLPSAWRQQLGTDIYTYFLTIPGWRHILKVRQTRIEVDRSGVPRSLMRTP
jgi:hypothetical protein